MPETGRPRSIAAEHYPLLVRFAHAQPYSSQAELAFVLLDETGITAHPDTFAKALNMPGITRLKPQAEGSFESPSLINPVATMKPTDANCRSSYI